MEICHLNPQQRAHCQDKLNRGKIKLDRSSNLYYEMENLPLQDFRKNMSAIMMEVRDWHCLIHLWVAQDYC